jgi:glycosyltransferase involved in cell wall biosynthesis
MKRHRVKLASPDHPLLEEMVEALCDEVDYSIRGPRFRHGAGGGVTKASGWRRLAQRMAAGARTTVVGTVLYQLARARALGGPGVPGQLTHAFSQLGLGGRWIGDYENVNVLGFYSPRTLRAPLFRAAIGRVLASPSCRAIRVWSEMGQRSFAGVFGETLARDKVVVIPPTIRLPELGQFPQRCTGGPPRLLFVGRGFWVKGGAIFLEAVRRVKGRHPLAVDFICDLPREVSGNYADLEGTVSFYRPEFTRAELYRRFFSQADAFVMLGMADSYGSVLLEAAAFQLPIIAMRLNSGLTDILRRTRNAIQVEPPVQLFDADGVHRIEPGAMINALRRGPDERTVVQVADAIERLVANAGLRTELGRQGQRALSEGDLSVEAMRAMLLKMYDAANLE